MVKLVISQLVLIFVMVHAKEGDESFKDIENQCNETFLMPYEYDKHILTFGSFPDESDKTPMCFIHCVMDKAGMMDAEGTYDEKVLVEKLRAFPNGTDVPDIEEIVGKCISENAQEDLCERAYGFGKCLLTEEIKRQSEPQKEE